MCGRFGFSSSAERAAKRFGARFGNDIPPQPPRYNIAPTQPVLAMLNDDQRSVAALRWGLIPARASRPAEMKLSTFNARIETIATARSYRGPLRSTRCAIFADLFYEWQRHEDGSKTPMLVRRRDGEPFCFAGLWDIWGRGDEIVQSCAIVTQPANEFLRTIHSRMPAILDDARVPAWLGVGERDPAEMLTLLAPQTSADWEAYPVSARVGNVKNDDPGLVERVERPIVSDSLFDIRR